MDPQKPRCRAPCAPQSRGTKVLRTMQLTVCLDRMGHHKLRCCAPRKSQSVLALVGTG